jgi:hypothetical protein
MTDYVVKNEELNNFIDLVPDDSNLTFTNKNLESSKDIVTVVDTPKSGSLEDDSKFARANIINLSMQIQEALSELHDVATHSQHPRAYEVFATLANTMLQSQKDLLSLHEVSHKLNNSENNTTQNTTNNIAFIGSSTELKKLLSDIGKF